MEHKCKQVREALRHATGSVERLLSRWEGDVRVRGALFLLLLLLIGGIQLALNIHTPLMMDDYDYSFNWSTGERIGGWGDVIASQAAHYRLWGGRSVVHALAQGFLSGDKSVFNLANAAMYLLLLLEMYGLARPKERRFCWPLLLAAHAVLFTCVPFFGTVFLWLTGSCNYLWGTVLALVPLLIEKSAREGGVFSRGAWGFLAVPVSLLAGWTNENTACGVFALTVLLLAGRALRGGRVRIWQWIALAAQAAGVALMLLAPGNFARASSYASGNLVVELLRRLLMATAYGVIYVGPLLIACLLLYAGAGALGAARRTVWMLCLLLGGALAAYAMIASPVFSDRSWTGVLALALTALLVLLGDIDAHVRAFDAAKLAVLPLAICLIAYGGYKALGDVRAHESAWQAQTQAAQLAAENGADSVTLSSVESHSRFTMDIILAPSAQEWPNSTLSRAFDVNVNGQ